MRKYLWVVGTLLALFSCASNSPDGGASAHESVKGLVNVAIDSGLKESFVVNFNGYAENTAYIQDFARNDFGYDSTRKLPNSFWYSASGSVHTINGGMLKVKYPANAYGTSTSGLQMRIPLTTGSTAQSERYLEYTMKLEPGFDDGFQTDTHGRGGKLPGLCGGSCPTGGKQATDGFSARLMFRNKNPNLSYKYAPQGKLWLVSYLYYNNLTEQYRRLADAAGNDVLLTIGQTYTIRERVKMNTGDNPDGELQIWVNGVEVCNYRDITWALNRSTPVYVDCFYFSTFFGGGDASWSPNTDSFISYDDIKVWGSTQQSSSALSSSSTTTSSSSSSSSAAALSSVISSRASSVISKSSAISFSSAAMSSTSSLTAVSSSGMTGGIKVQFYNGSTAASGNQIYGRFKLWNTSTAAIALSTIKINYYYTLDGSQNQQFWCDWSQAGSANITGTFKTISPAKPAADVCLEVGFKSTAGSLAPGSYVEVQTRTAKTDWSNYNQSNDYSFNPSATAYIDWLKVTASVNGVRQWGVEP